MKKKDREKVNGLEKEFRHVFFKNNHGRFIWAMALNTVFNSALNLFASYLLQYFTDTVGKKSDSLLVKGGVMMGGMLALELLLCLLLPKANAVFYKRAVSQYRDLAFQKMLKKQIGSLKGNNAVYVSALTNDMTEIETKYLQELFVFFPLVVTFVGAFAFMLWENALMTLGAVVLGMIPLLFTLNLGKSLPKKEEKVSVRYTAFTQVLTDFLSGFDLIKNFRVESQMERQLSNENAALEDSKMSRNVTDKRIRTLSGFANSVSQFGILFLGAWLSYRFEDITPGMVILFVQMMNYVFYPIEEAPNYFAARKATRSLAKRLSCALEEKSAEGYTGTVAPLEKGIKFSDVRFSYGENEVLKGIDLWLPWGGAYAIVGDSGSGKSTILKLLMGQERNYKGHLLYDGTELNTVNENSLFSNITLVQQDVFLFNSSLKYNLTMFRDIGDEEIMKAVNAAGLRQLVEEKGLDYSCGVSGSNLSGGEKQRVAVARSLLHKASVLMLDEATSALDHKTAVQVNESILGLKGITRIVVTHAMDERILSGYDRIFVLRNGKIAEQGKFGELMEKKGYFYALFTVLETREENRAAATTGTSTARPGAEARC